MEDCSAGYCSVGCDKYLSLDTERVTTMVLQAGPLRFFCAEWKQCDPLGILFNNVEWKLCIAIVTAVGLAHRSLIKTESRTAKIRQVDSHCQGFTGKWTSKWTPIFTLLIFASLSFLDSFFPRGLLLRKKSFSTTLHGVFPFHVGSRVSRYLNLKKKLKHNSNISYIFVKSFWISLPINAKKNLRGNTFFFLAKHTYSFWKFWSSSWSSTVKIPKPGLPPDIQVTSFCRFEYLQRNSVGQMLSMEVRVLRCSLQAWLRNVYSETVHTSVTRSIWIQAKSNSYTSEVP